MSRITFEEESSNPFLDGPSHVARPAKTVGNSLGPAVRQRTIWIDLDNSPHVPFFVPIIEELRKRGHEVYVTARNSYQVCGLVEFHGISCKVIGRHWGKHRVFKILGTLARTVQLAFLLIGRRADLAVSHGSRSQLLCSKLLGIPTVTMYDYEFTARVGSLKPDWVFMPRYVPVAAGLHQEKRLLRYPGLKEDVYVPRFQPDSTFRQRLGLGADEIVVTMRPPATEAHYHNPDSEKLFDSAIARLVQIPEVRIVLLPRNDGQGKAARVAWKQWIDEAKIVIPSQVMDGLNVIWYSDLVISGGGTMNREAAALGIPVYSVFRGRIGAVDQYLSDCGRLVLLESVEDVEKKVVVVRNRPELQQIGRKREALPCIVEGIASIAEQGRLPQFLPTEVNL
jgi:uncharacterized protein